MERYRHTERPQRPQRRPEINVPQRQRINTPIRPRRKSIFPKILAFLIVTTTLVVGGAWAYSIVMREMQAHAQITFPHYIEWDFRTYSAPDFDAEITGYFQSKEVVAYEIRDDGWARISTDEGPQWVYTNSQVLFITRPMGLFTSIGDTEAVGIIAPQAARLLETAGYWSLIETWMGEKWVYENFLPPAYALYDYFSHFGTELAIFYKNLCTGFVYMHNPDRIFFGASLAKANHALYVYTLAEQGLLDMYAVHTFTASDHWGGTGIIRFKPAGTQFTTRELLAHSIIHSCNVAYRMLVRLTANMELSFHDFTRSISAYPGFIRDVISQNGSARDMGLWMYAIFNYIGSDSRYGHYFMYDLMNTAPYSHHYFTRWEGSFGVGGDVNVSLIQSDYPMARKYGWATNAFHEAAIIYGASPYIIIVMSNMERGAHDLFEEISFFIQDFNREWFGGERDDMPGMDR